MLAVYDAASNDGTTVCQLYDPLLNSTNDVLLTPVVNEEYCVILQHILRTVIPGRSLRSSIVLPPAPYNRQATNDFSSCGVFVCFYARQYLENGFIYFVPSLDIQQERQNISRLVRSVNDRQTSTSVLFPENEPEEEQPPTVQDQTFDAENPLVNEGKLQKIPTRSTRRQRGKGRNKKSRKETLTAQCERMRAIRSRRNQDERNLERAENRERMRETRSRMNADERVLENAARNERMRVTRSRGNADERVLENAAQNERMRVTRSRMNADERVLENAAQRERMRVTRSRRNADERDLEHADQREL